MSSETQSSDQLDQIGPRPGRLELILGDEEEQDQQEEASSSHYDRTNILTALEGQKIARIVPAADDKPNATVRVGHNVTLAEDGKTIVAAASGRIRVDKGAIWIEKALEVAGDVAFTTGNIQFDNDVLIRGSVLDLFKVNSKASVIVNQAIEAAIVYCGNDLVVRGGIVGKDKGYCYAAHDMRARYLSNARVEAGNNIIIDSQVTNSSVSCGATLMVRGGPIVAGHVAAAGGIRCLELGCESGVATIASAGLDRAFEEKAGPEIESLEQKLLQAQKVRSTVEPLMQNQKRLTPAQKEKATELLFEASQVEEDAANQLKALKERIAQIHAQTCAEICVSKILYPGAVLRFPGVQTTIDTLIRGAVRIIPKTIGDRIQIVSIRQSTGASTPLETRPIKESAVAMAQRLIARLAA